MASSFDTAAQLASRYAKALFELADEADVLEAVQEDLSRLRQALQQPELRQAVASPRLTRAQKGAVLQQLAKIAEANALTLRFLGLVAEKGRLHILPQIASAFEARLREKNNVVEVEVTSATPLTPAQEKSLATALKESLNKTVVLNLREDAGLLGGMTVRIGSTLLDHSLQNRLEHLKRTLKHAATAA